MYELMILSVLIQRPAHGYLIAKAVNNVLGPFAKVNNGRLYPLLSKMEEQGLIVSVEARPSEPDNERPVNTFRATEAGHKYFQHLMMDTASNLGDYQKIFWLKIPVFQYIKPDEKLYLLDHYSNYCQSHFLHLSGKAREYSEPKEGAVIPPNYLAVLNAIEHRIKHWQLELEWVKQLREELLEGKS